MSAQRTRTKSRSVRCLEVELLEERNLLDSSLGIIPGLTDSDAGRLITGLYTDLLYRVPGPAEVAGWAAVRNAGASPADLARYFTQNAEYRGNLVTDDYENLLGREPAPAEVAGWVAALNQGMTEQSLAAVFLGSDEYYTRQGGTVDGWLDGLYQDALGRSLDDASRSAWEQLLQGGTNRTTVAAAVVGSTEAHTRLVAATYPRLLDRPADAQGQAAWTAALDQGLLPSDFTAAIAGSPEYVLDQETSATVAAATSAPLDSAPTERHLDFGTSWTPLAPGYTRVPLVAYTAARGLGWQDVVGLAWRNRDTDDPLLCDFQAGRDQTFLVDLAPGTYDVTVTLGDAKAHHDNMAVWLQGQLVASGVTTRAGEFVRPTFRITLSSGPLSVRLASAGGSAPTFALAALDIAAPTAPPVAQAGPAQSANEGAPVTFAGNILDGTAPFTSTWDFGDGTSAADTLAPIHSYADNGTYTVTLTVTDSLGRTSQSSTTATVANVAPTAYSGGPYTGSPGLPINFQAAATDPSPADLAAGLQYAWLFGDGTSGSGSLVSHTYPLAGTYTVTLIVADKDGGSTSATTTATVTTVPEGLTEEFARKARRKTATWGASELEDPSTYIWQPQTLMYTDVQTGHEVWKLSDTPDLATYYHNDIGVSPWSADGRRLAVTAVHWSSLPYDYGPQGTWDNDIWLTMNTDGLSERPVVEGPRRATYGYFHWSPQVPDTYYEVGSHLLNNDAVSENVLYKAVVGDTSVSIAPVLTLPFAEGDIGKMISEDGRHLIVSQWQGDTTPYRWYPVTIPPDGSARLDVPLGYSEDRNFGHYGGMTFPVYHFHDAYYPGTGDWFFALPVGPTSTSTWWMVKTLGSAPDRGAPYTGDNGSHQFGEVWPENNRGVLPGNLPSPFAALSTEYDPTRSGEWSHFVPDPWGRYALFSSNSDHLPRGIGPGIWDISNHVWVVPSFGGGAQHHDWHGFTDWSVSSSEADTPAEYLSQRLYAQDFTDPNSQITVAFTHTLYNGNGQYIGDEYSALARPAESPDGTKVAFHSTFLNPDDGSPDVYWAVVHYPSPPTTLGAATTAGGVQLSWLPATYTDRRWINPATGKIDETNGEVLYARETKRYHLWRSAGPNGPWQEVEASDAHYANDPVTNTLKPVAADGAFVSPTDRLTLIDNPGDGTWYYAMTSEEWSGLESHQLSEVLRVTVRGGQVTDSTDVGPAGQTGFAITPPAAPTNLTVVQQSIAGQHRLTWTEPADNTIRYYNVYYSSTGNPQAVQAERIASVAVGTHTYLDWLADPTRPGFYGITAVSRQGVESAIVYVTHPTAPRNGDSAAAPLMQMPVPAFTETGVAGPAKALAPAGNAAPTSEQPATPSRQQQSSGETPAPAVSEALVDPLWTPLAAWQSRPGEDLSGGMPAQS